MIKPDNNPAADSLGSEDRLDQLLDRFEEAWRGGHRPAIDDFLPPGGRNRRYALLGLACIDLQHRLMGGEVARVEDYLARFPELAGDPAAILELIKAEHVERRRGERALGPEEFCRRFPQHQEQVRAWFDSPESPPALAPETPPPQPSPPAPQADAPSPVPERIGRYRVVRILGEGGFGSVYLARDDHLDRLVAIKVPRRDRVSSPQDIAAYLAEARLLARLDHPHIVPVYDSGSTEDGWLFVVSKYVEGSDLARRIREGRPPFAESAAIVAAVAEALQYAHSRGLVHRDVKPANILLDQAGKPFLADFGLALKEEDFGRGPGFAGTPAYMSPEQARGEGHRVDGRSDVFSLGVVLYELLAGRRPFRGQTQDELLGQIARMEARPPRQTEQEIPAELERICLKALAKRASERYTTAGDLAGDLRHFLAGPPLAVQPPVAMPVALAVAPAITAAPAIPTEPKPARVVPKGLRSFDATSRFLPGPAARPPRPRRAAREHPLLENANRGGGCRQDLQRRLDLRAFGLREEFAGEGRPAAPPGRACRCGLRRGDRRGHGGTSAQGAEEVLPEPACRGGAGRSGGGPPPRHRVADGQEGTLRPRSIRAMAARQAGGAGGGTGAGPAAV